MTGPLPQRTPERALRPSGLRRRSGCQKDLFILHLAVRDAEHLRDVAMDAFTARPEVAQLETHLLFEVTRDELPIYVADD